MESSFFPKGILLFCVGSAESLLLSRMLFHVGACDMNIMSVM